MSSWWKLFFPLPQSLSPLLSGVELLFFFKDSCMLAGKAYFLPPQLTLEYLEKLCLSAVKELLIVK